jgi:hypothetical protein
MVFQITDDRKQMTEDKGKKVSGWEGEKVRIYPNFEIRIRITFNLLPINYRPFFNL